MKVFKRLKREGLLSYCDKLPFPVIVIDPDCNVVLMNDKASKKFTRQEGRSKCYEITHGTDRPCWEVQGKYACPVKRLQNGEEPYAHHEHDERDFHILVAEKLDEALFMELYLDSYITDLISELRFLADTDGLTGFYNRRKVEEILTKEIERSRRYGNALSLLFIDVDNFKDLNDTYGHQKGDEVLKKIAGVINRELRRTDYVGRFGGEEFLVILPETDADRALKVAERIRRRIEFEDFGIGPVTVSIGVTQLKGGDDIDTLFNRVDRAMYLAKEKGKNRSEVL